LIKELAPTHQIVRAIPPTSADVHLGVMAGIPIGDHLELGTTRLQCDKKEHALGVQRRVHITSFTRRSDPIEHAKRWMVEVALGSHRYKLSLKSTVLTTQAYHQ
jgi:hypothetical protein